MWKNPFSSLAGTPPAAPNHNHGGDEDDDEGDDQTEEGGEEAFDGDEYWDAVEENDYSWICRACIGEIDSVTDKWQEIGRARVHVACLVCAICMQKTDHIEMIAHAPWFYCKSCMELALLEAKLRKGAEVWQIGFLPAPAPPPEEPLVEFATLQDFVAKFVDAASVEEAVRVVKEAGVEGESPADWHSKLYELALQRKFFRLPLSKVVLSQIHQAVHPREGPPSPPAPEPIEVTRAKLRATVVSAAEFVKHSINWISNNRTVSGYRLPPSHPYPINLLRLSRYALSLARQICAKAKQLGMQGTDEELREMQTVVQTIRALVTAMELHQAEPDLREPVVDGRDIQGNLPRDICKLILGCLDARSLVNCRLVNRWWCTLSDEEELWRQLFKRDWGAHKVLTDTWKQAYVTMYKEMHFLSDEVRIVRRLGPIDPSSNPAVGRWCLLGITRKYHAPPPPLPRVLHPLSSPALLLNLQLSMQQLLDYADLELGSRGCDTSPVLRDRRVVLHMLNRYAKWMHIRTTYPDACLVPTDDIALVWVTHTLRPDLYDQDCKKLYGRVVPRDGVTDRALDVLFWDGLRQTEQLWRKHFNTDYSLRPPGFVQEAEDNVAFRLDIAQNGSENPPPEPGYYENFATGGKAQDDPDAEEIIEAAEKENAKEPDWQNPFSITVDDVLLDRMWSAYFDRFVRSIRSSKLGSVHAYICAKSLKNYEKFLYLQLKYPDVELIPNYFIQLALRAHMVNPIAYREDMMRLFGRVPPRSPWAGPDKLMALQRTRELWLEEYGTEMDLEALSSQLNDAAKARTPAEEELEKKIITETDPEDLCSVFVRKSVPIVPSVRVALDNNFCTYSATGLDFATQTYVHCETCIDEGRFAEDEGVCMTCARVCHLGHELSEQVTERPFFCDCGPSGHCNCLAPAGWKPPLTAPPSAQDNTEDGDDEPVIAP